MKKFKNAVRTALLIAAAVLLLCSCGKKTEESSSQGSQSLTAAQIFDKAQQSSSADMLDSRLTLGDDTFDQSCEKLFGVSADKLADGGVMYISSGAAADEISVIKLSDGSSAKQLLEQRRDDRRGDFEGYAPDELEKIDSALIFEYGGADIMIISDNAEQIADAIKK